MTTKKYLLQICELNMEIAADNELRRELKNQLRYIQSVAYSDVKTSSTAKSSIEEKIVKYEKFIENITKKIDKRYKLVQEISKQINTLPKSKYEPYSQILSMRYISNMKWSEIAKKLGWLSEGYVNGKLHQAALNTFEKQYGKLYLNR